MNREQDSIGQEKISDALSRRQKDGTAEKKMGSNISKDHRIENNKANRLNKKK